MMGRVGFAIGLCVFGIASVASAQETPWLFVGGTSDVAAIVDVDGDGPDPTDDCYFKVTGIPGLTGTFTLSFVDAMGESCNDDFPCTGSFDLSPGVLASVELVDCEQTDVAGLIINFFRPGPPVPTNALLSPNRGEIPVDQDTAGALLCTSNGPAVLLDNFGMTFLFALEFFPNATNPTHVVFPNVGGALVSGNGQDIYVPLFNRAATIASSSAPSTTAIELDFGGLCDCSLGGICSTTAAAPAMGTFGLAFVALSMLVIGALAMRRRPGFARSIPMP